MTAFTASKDFHLLECVSFHQKKDSKSSIFHSGDIKGRGKGDDQTINVNLYNIDPEVMYIGFYVNVETNHKNFSNVWNSYCRIFDPNSKTEYFKYNLNNKEEACFIAYMIRDINNNTWKLKPLGKLVEALTTRCLVMEIELNITEGRSYYNQFEEEISGMNLKSNNKENVGCECRLF